MANPAETAYLSFQDRELSNDVPLVEFQRRKVVVHTFLWVVPGHCLCAGFMESHNFFVLHPIRVKFHIQTRLIESFATTYQSWCCAEEQLHFTPVHTLCQLKRDEGQFPPLPSCDTWALHGSLILFIHFKPAFSKPFFSPVVPCNRGTWVHVCHSSFAFYWFLKLLIFWPILLKLHI